MLRASVRDRQLLPASQVMDLRFHEYMKDNFAAVERVFAFCEEPFDAATQARVRAFLELSPKGRHGTIDYRLEDLGLDARELRLRLRFYCERFGLSFEEGD